MKLDIKAIAIAEAIVGAILFVLCRVAFAVAPSAMLGATKYLFHVDFSSITIPINWGGFFSGLVVFSAALGLVGAVWAWIYNRMARA